MRAFIAIELPAEIKKYLSGLQEKLKATGAEVKWVKPLNIHLTLKFLGEIDQEQFKRICETLDRITKESAGYTISLGSVGAFPKITSPRTIWAGIEKGGQQTQDLAERIEVELVKIGRPKEIRPYSSHITIGRTKSPLNRNRLIQELNNLADSPEALPSEFPVTKIILYKSTLTIGGPIYEVLHEANLKNS